MGYLVSSIFSVSPDDAHEVFVYFIPGRNPYYRLETEWINRWVINNFALVAQRLGPTGVLIAPTDAAGSFFEEVLQAHNGFPRPFMDQARGEDQLLHEPFPFLIISKRPITKEKSDECQSYYFNLVRFANERELARFFDCIVECVRRSDKLERIVELFPDQEAAEEPTSYGRVVEDLNSMFQLKPNVFGVGVNLNEAIDRFGQWLKTRKAQKR